LALLALAGVTVVGLLWGTLHLSDHEWWFTAAWRWATLRSHFVPKRVEGFFPIGEVALVEWADGRAAFLAMPVMKNGGPGQSPKTSTVVVWEWWPNGAQSPNSPKSISPDDPEWASPRWTNIQLGAQSLVSDFGIFTYGRPVWRFGLTNPPLRFSRSDDSHDLDTADRLRSIAQQVIADQGWTRCTFER
jgi:hypothetical protein